MQIATNVTDVNVKTLAQLVDEIGKHTCTLEESVCLRPAAPIRVRFLKDVFWGDGHKDYLHAAAGSLGWAVGATPAGIMVDLDTPHNDEFGCRQVLKSLVVAEIEEVG